MTTVFRGECEGFCDALCKQMLRSSRQTFTRLSSNPHKEYSAYVVRKRDPEIRACRVESSQVLPEITVSLGSMSNPRRKADAFDAEGTMPDDAKERLRKSLQSCLRQTLLRLVTVLDTSEVGTSRLLAVPLGHLHTFVPGTNVEGLACADQWAALSRRVGARTRTPPQRDLVLPKVWQYEPNLRVQALPTVVHRPAESVLLRCTVVLTSHFVELVLRPPWHRQIAGVDSVCWTQPSATGCANVGVTFDVRDRRESILDVFTRLDFCEHATARIECVSCVMAVLFVSTGSGASGVVSALTS